MGKDQDFERGAGRILIVDDDPDVLEMVATSLQAMGYDTLVSRNGRDALEAVRSDGKIDLLLTDVIMPGGLNGAELAKEARRLRPDLRVLLTTGIASVGADPPTAVDDTFPLLKKPYRQPELARMVRAVLRSW